MKTKEELLESLEKVKIVRGGGAIDRIYMELKKIALDSGADSLLESFVDYEMLEVLTKRELEENSVWVVKAFLDGITTFSRNVYLINGYNHASDVTLSDLEWLKDDLKIFINDL